MIKPVNRSKPVHILPLRLPLDIVDRLDYYAELHGIKTRTQAIISLMNYAIDNIPNPEGTVEHGGDSQEA